MKRLRIVSIVLAAVIAFPISAISAPANAAVTLINTIPTVNPNTFSLVSAGLIGDKIRFVLAGATTAVSVKFTGSAALDAAPVPGVANTYQVVVPVGTTTGPVTVSANGGALTASSTTDFQVWKTRSEPYVMPTGHLNVTYNDLQFILDQIKMAEAHSARTTKKQNQLSVGTASGSIIYPYDVTSADRCLTAADVANAGGSTYGATGLSGSYLWTVVDPLGLRTVDGNCNNISAVKTETNPALPGDTQDTALWGSANQLFPRLGAQYNTSTATGLSPAQQLYKNPTASVTDPSPRTISSLIADQSKDNPAAVAAAYDAMDTLYTLPAYSTGISVNATTGIASTVLDIPNITADYNVSAGYNSWFTLFGQFFDHGLDLVPKAGAAVLIPIGASDPLYVDGAPNMMVLTRAADANGQSINETTPWIDQSQTYGSHASQNFFLRQYTITTSPSFSAVSNGRLIEDPAGGLPTWKTIKAQAASMGLLLQDTDARSVPVIATDQYGKFIAGPNGFPLMLMKSTTATSYKWVEGSLDSPLATSITGWKAVGSGHAFINDTTADAVPFAGGQCGPTAGQPLRVDDDHIINSAASNPSCSTYDDEMLDAHLVAGDGRVNENIGLSAIHNTFHSEHNLLVADIKNLLTKNPVIPANFVAEWNGERLYQAARFIMEMEYQHMAYDEFVRRLAPELPLFLTYDPGKNAAVTAEFASAVYRLGHSMLNETIARSNPGSFYDPTDNQDVSLLTAFTNPVQARLARPAFVTGADHNGITITYTLASKEVAPANGSIVSVTSLADSDFNIRDGKVINSTSTTFDIAQHYDNGALVNNTAPLAASTTSLVQDGTSYAVVTISDPGSAGFLYTPDEATAAIAQGMSSQRGNEIDEFVTDGVRNNLLGLPLDLATLNITRGRDVGLPTLNQFRKANGPKLRPYISWQDFIENGLRHSESGSNFIAAYGTHPSIIAATTVSAKRAAGIAITTAAKSVAITDATQTGSKIVYKGFNTYSAGQHVKVSEVSYPAESCNVLDAVVESSDVTSFTVTAPTDTKCDGYKLPNASLSGSGGTAEFLSNGNATVPAVDVQSAKDFYTSTGAYASVETGINYVDLWMGGLAENPAKQPILAPMLGTTFQYIFTEQMQRLQDNDRFYYLGRLVGMNLFGEIPAQKFTDIVRRNTPSASSGNLTGTKGILGMNNPGFAISDCAYSKDVALVPVSIRCGSGTMKTDSTGLLTHKGLDNITMFANPTTIVSAKIAGGDGDDSIQGGPGNDYLTGGASGGDLIDGAAGNDIVIGGAGEDLLKGGAGNDVINSGTSQIGDIADGGSGSDFMHCGECTGVIASFIGEAGNDFIQGGKNADLKLDGGEGDDWIEGGAGWDIIDGDSGPLLNILINLPVWYGGNDVINGQSGQDVIFGDGGDDIFLLGDGPVFPDGTFGFDWANYEYNIRYDNSPLYRANTWADLSGALVNPNTARSNDVLVNIEGLSGSPGNDQLFGGLNVGDITLPALTGNATSYGLAGQNTLTLPGAFNIVGGSMVTGAGIAPHAMVLALVGIVTANSTTIQLSGVNTANVRGPIRITTAPLEVPSLISGLPELVTGTPGSTQYKALNPDSTVWSGGGIILGGEGNDTVYPTSGADVLHGSAYLHTCIGITASPVPTAVAAATDVVCGIGAGRGFSTMSKLAPFMDAGLLTPDDLQIVREVLPTATRVTAITSSNGSVVYTAANNFFVGESVAISGLVSTSGADTTSYMARSRVITAATPTSFTVSLPAAPTETISDISAGSAVGTDTLDLSGGQTLSVGAAPVPGGGLSGPSSQFTFRALTTPLPAGATYGCTMTDSVSGNVTTLYDFQFVKFDTGNVQNISTNCGGNTAPGRPTNVAATAGALSARVTWNAPADNGTPIDYYKVQMSVGTGTNIFNMKYSAYAPVVTGTCAGNVVIAAGSPVACTVTDLTAGTSVRFQVQAHNLGGLSRWSTASTAVTVRTTTPIALGNIGGIPTTVRIAGAPFTLVDPTVTAAGTPLVLPASGVFTYSSSSTALGVSGKTVTPVQIGMATITATFTPVDLVNYAVTTKTAIVIILPAATTAPAATPPVVTTPGAVTPPVAGLSILLTPAVGPFTDINPVKLSVTGAGTARVLFSTNTAGCRIVGTDLTAAGNQTCNVSARTLSATPLTATTDVTFVLADQAPLLISNGNKTSKVNFSITLRTSGGSGGGAVTYVATGAGCTVKNNDQLTSTQKGDCSVVATKSGGTVYNPVDSAAVVFTFR